MNQLIETQFQLRRIRRREKLKLSLKRLLRPSSCLKFWVGVVGVVVAVTWNLVTTQSLNYPFPIGVQFVWVWDWDFRLGLRLVQFNLDILLNSDK